MVVCRRGPIFGPPPSHSARVASPKRHRAGDLVCRSSSSGSCGGVAASGWRRACSSRRCAFPLPDDIRLPNGEHCPQGLGDCTMSWADDVESLRPDIVVVALNDPGDADNLHDGRRLHACMPEYDTWLRQEWHRAIDLLSATGAKVVSVTPGYSEISRAPEARLARTDCANAVMRQVAEERPEAVVADVARDVCPSLPCRQEVNGTTLRPDGVHHVGESAEYMAGWIPRRGPRGDRRRGLITAGSRRATRLSPLTPSG